LPAQGVDCSPAVDTASLTNHRRNFMRRPYFNLFTVAAGAVLVAALGVTAHAQGAHLFGAPSSAITLHSESSPSAEPSETPEPSESPEATPTPEPAETPEPSPKAEPTDKPEAPDETDTDQGDNSQGDNSDSGSHDSGGGD
jgi:outer membrane biosynthesis protein TonB